MRSLFDGAPADRAAIAAEVVASPAGRVALDPSVDWKTSGDLDRAIAIDRFPFAMPVGREGGLLVARALHQGVRAR